MTPTTPERPKCRCGADAWVEGYCAKCFRASKGIGQNEFVLHRADGVWVVVGSSPQLAPGDEVASARGLAGLTKDGVPWVEGTASGRRWGQDAKTGDLLGGRQYRHRQHEDGSYTIEESLDGADWSVVHSVCGGCGAVRNGVLASGRCPNCPLSLEERVELLSHYDRDRLAEAAQLVVRLRRLEDEAAAIRESLVPEIPHEVLGFREWKFDAFSWQLEAAGSMGRGVWLPGVNHAKCGSTSIPAPCERDGHHCGFNIYARVCGIGSYFGRPDISAVPGAVLAWSDEGRFYVHEGVGFRAECARVVVLCVDERWPRAKRSAVRAIAEDFEVPTCRPDDLELAASEFGEFCPEDVLAWSRGETSWPGADAGAVEAYERLTDQAAELRATIRDYCHAVAGEHLSAVEVDQLVGLDRSWG